MPLSFATFPRAHSFEAAGIAAALGPRLEPRKMLTQPPRVSPSRDAKKTSMLQSVKLTRSDKMADSRGGLQRVSESVGSTAATATTVNTEDDGRSSDTDAEDAEAEKRVVQALELEKKQQDYEKELKQLQSQLEAEKDEQKAADIKAKIKKKKRTKTSIEGELEQIVSMVQQEADESKAALGSVSRGTGRLWVRALFPYKPVAKPTHTWFDYDDIIEVLETDVKEEEKKIASQSLDMFAFLAEDEDDDEPDVPIKYMRGRVLAKVPERKAGLFPSNYVQDVRKFVGNFKVPGYKSNGSSILKTIRGKVSKKKRRFMAEGFDLDLSYITPKLIAMGIPAGDMSAIYRNNLGEVTRFLTHFHADHYQLYNLCNDRAYDVKKFNSRVVQYGFEDHNPCPFDMLEPFCKHLKTFLDQDEKNVAAIHCKAGKGRTGLMIATFLVYTQQLPTPNDSLRFFAVKRTKNCKGVTIPSQMRYVRYFSKYMQQKRLGKFTIPYSRPMKLVSVRLSPRPKMAENAWFVIDAFGTQELKAVNKIKSVKNTNRIDTREGFVPPTAVLDRRISSSKVMKRMKRQEDAKGVFWEMGEKGIAILDGDIRMSYYTRPRLSLKKQKLLYFWFNTRFLEPDGSGVATLELTKPELDKACKDKKNKTFPADFKVTLTFRAAS